MKNVIMRNLMFTLAALLMMPLSLLAQTEQEMLIQKEAKSEELKSLESELNALTGRVNSLNSEVAALTEQLTPYPRWDIGAAGNFGFNFANFSDWLSKSNPNTTAFTIGLSTNGFANLQQPKYFWRNGGTLTLGWVKFDDRDDLGDSDAFKVSADALNISSLFGYKLSEKFAISALAEYRTSVLEGTFNDPGYLDLGAGATWTPINDLVVVLHPLNYNLIFSTGIFEYTSTLGCKVVADYKKQISKGIAWKSNLSAFASYEGSDFSNWTWINGFTTAVKGFGVGLDLGLRSNKQEALAVSKTNNPLQTYWILGLSYAL